MKRETWVGCNKLVYWFSLQSFISFMYIHISPCVKLAAMIIKDILVKAKITPLEKIKTVAAYVKVLGVKYANMLLWLRKDLDLPVAKENLVLSPTNWTVIPAMFCFFFHVKNAQNNAQVVIKVFDLDLTITVQSIEVSLKEIPSNNCHFTFILRMANIMV